LQTPCCVLLQHPEGSRGDAVAERCTDTREQTGTIRSHTRQAITLNTRALLHSTQHRRCAATGCAAPAGCCFCSCWLPVARPAAVGDQTLSKTLNELLLQMYCKLRHCFYTTTQAASDVFGLRQKQFRRPSKIIATVIVKALQAFRMREGKFRLYHHLEP
jgi:hypothetical protein